MDDNLSAVLYAAQDLRLEQRSIPKPKENEVLVAVQCVGICGSDVHYWWLGRCGRFEVTSPMVLGHEAAGVVVSTGEKVTNLVAGDRVALEPGIPCRTCQHCKDGHYNICPSVEFCATPPVHGTLTRYYCHPADFCFKLPENMTLEEGALLEPLSVAVHSCSRAGVKAGSRVLITGAGPIGLVSLLVAKAAGAIDIVITDVLASRLEIARNLGATHTELIDRDTLVQEVADRIQKATDGGPDCTIECSGAESSIQLGILAMRPSGTLVTVGRGPLDITIPQAAVVIKEININGIFRYRNCYPAAISLISSGQVSVKSLITHRFSLEETLKAFETAHRGDGIKVMILVGDKI